MTGIRSRRHTDGRAALYTPNAYRFNWFCRNEDTPKCQWLTDDDVAAPGWSELLVASLPAPDGHFKTGEPYWNAFDGLPEFVARSDSRIETMHGAVESPVGIRSSALKMLAAVAACEQFRAQREMTT